MRVLLFNQLEHGSLAFQTCSEDSGSQSFSRGELGREGTALVLGTLFLNLGEVEFSGPWETCLALQG